VLTRDIRCRLKNRLHRAPHQSGTHRSGYCFAVTSGTKVPNLPGERGV